MDNYNKKKRAAAIAVAYYLQELNNELNTDSNWHRQGRYRIMDNREKMQRTHLKKRA